ncbi:uncharacterized protein [Amphiura filiformis]|uniref:uncharacterized protein n=1 Tax=Amphiura filiformis TaxID=82378 RepID=UPI003B20FFF9
MELGNRCRVISVLLFIAQFQVAPTATSCKSGEYRQDGGGCIECAPCPKYQLNDWINEDCYENFSTCPNLCTVPPRKWLPHELADDRICENPPHQYTTQRSTTDEATTMMKPNHTTSNKGVTDSITPPTGAASSNDGGEGRNMPVDLPVIIIAGFILLLVIIVTLCFLYKRLKKRPVVSSEVEEKTAFISKICNKSSPSGTAYSILISGHKLQIDSDVGVDVHLCLGNKLMKYKALTSEDVPFGFIDGVRPGRSYTLKYIRQSDAELGESLKSTQYTTPDFFTSVSSSSTSITTQYDTPTFDASVNLFDKIKDIKIASNIRMTSNQASNIKMTSNQARFGLDNGVLPAKTYRLQVVESGNSNWTDEQGKPWKEEHEISTPAWTFQSEVDEACKIKIENLPSDENALALREKCSIEFCSCVKNVNGGKKYCLPPSGSSVSLDCPLNEWRSMPVKLCISNNEGKLHVAGEQRIQNKGTDQCDNQPKICTCTFKNADHTLKKSLCMSLNPEKFKLFCLIFIEICNNPQIGKDHFPEDLAQAEPSADKFLEEMSTLFAGDTVQGTTIYQLVERLVIPKINQLCPDEIALFTAAILRYHDCSACRTLIHRRLHEEENAYHLVAADGSAPFGECQTSESSYQIDGSEGDWAISSLSSTVLNDSVRVKPIVNGNATHIGTPVIGTPV